MTILVIDDSRFMQLAIDKALREAGYTTILAGDGERGWSAALQGTPANGEALSVDGGSALTTTAVSVTATGSYSSNASHTVTLGIPSSATSGQSFSDVVVFTAIAN